MAPVRPYGRATCAGAHHPPVQGPREGYAADRHRAAVVSLMETTRLRDGANRIFALWATGAAGGERSYNADHMLFLLGRMGDLDEQSARWWVPRPYWERLECPACGWMERA